MFENLSNLPLVLSATHKLQFRISLGIFHFSLFWLLYLEMFTKIGRGKRSLKSGFQKLPNCLGTYNGISQHRFLTLIHQTLRILFLLAEWDIHVLISTLLILMSIIFIWFAYLYLRWINLKPPVHSTGETIRGRAKWSFHWPSQPLSGSLLHTIISTNYH